MGVDLHRIGTGISSGSSHNGFGSIVSFPASGGGGGGPPAYGTVLGSGNEDLNVNWNYSDNSRSGQFVWGYTGYLVKADGFGGTFIDYSGNNTETATHNQVMDDYEFKPYTRIIYKGGSGYEAGTWNECQRAGIETGSSGGGTYSVNINGNSYSVGSYMTVEKSDGYCGTYNDTTNDYYPYGTYITTWYNYASDVTYDSYCDGYGGYYDVQQ